MSVRIHPVTLGYIDHCYVIQDEKAILIDGGTPGQVESFRKGNIWLNVFKTDNGQILATVNKTYRDKNGQWGRTPFLNPRQGDIRDLVDAVEAFRQFEKMLNAGGQR